MKLNIHLISHPLIQNLSSITRNSYSSYNMRNQYFKSLGLLIIYETIRTWTKIHKLTIKTTKKEKELIIIDPKESYTIVFDNLDYVNMFQDIQFILPKLNLKLIEQKNEKNYTLFNFSPNIHHRILIVNYRMDTKFIKNLIEGLIREHNIKLKQIRLTCVECKTEQLIQLSELYDNLTIYTTKIINT